VRVRTATKNQLLGQLDRAFPGLTLALSDLLGTRAGLIAAHVADQEHPGHRGRSRPD
jgi:hypothetical protein